MRCTPVFALVEPLEARIAPATIFVGGPNDSYTTTPGFFSTDPAKIGANYDPTDPFGANYVGGTHTYYLKLVAGDVVKAYSTEGYKDELIHVQSGTAIAFFTDIVGGDNAYQATELTGLSLGKNAGLVVKGSVNGDVVGNFNDATGKIEATSLINGTQALKSFVVDNADSLMFGGAINKVTGKVINRVLTGTAADGMGYDFNANDSGNNYDAFLSFIPLNKQKGSGISNVILTGTDLIRAGDGGAGGIGGSISNISLTADSDGFLLEAGNGGNGNATVGAGGAGGSVSKIYDQGTADITPNSPGLNPATLLLDPAQAAIQILSGKGGNGFEFAKGGAGGKMDSVYVGYESVSGKITASTHLSQDSVLVSSGGGGDGAGGGAGGAVTNAKVRSLAPYDPAHPDIEVVGGDGGAATKNTATKAGAGGSLSGLVISEINVTDSNTDVYLHAGSGGASLASGGNGGSVANATLIAFHVRVDAGTGSNGTDFLVGKTGGIGGSLTSLTIPISSEGIIPQSLILNAGNGGDAKAGNGAAGGNVSKINLNGADLSGLSSITTGTGGAGLFGKGGNGGSASSIQIVDGDFTATLSGAFSLTAGDGGSGATVGGNGGALSTISFVADDLSYTVQSGTGGKGNNGNGGNGGAITKAAFNTLDDNGAQSYSGTIFSGAGGDGSGVKGSGGAGGDITGSSGAADSFVQIIGGKGGDGAGKSAGKGSSLKNVALEARGGNATVQAGNAGSAGTLPGVGGSITSANVIGTFDVSILAGNGQFGGSGGSITSVGYSGLGQEPFGTVTVRAGDGSSGGKTAGAGGSINTLFGFVGDVGLTKISAGNGSNSGDLKKASVGGSILHVALEGGGNGFGNELQIQAGDAGNAAQASTGAKGGDVKDLAVTQLGFGCIFRFIAAGDGGDATKTGGLGGTIDQVAVQGSAFSNGDIGVRSGEIFGYDTMGGLFAGTGGTGTKAGIAGNVTNIVADAIASIVAGRMQNGDTITAANLVNKVDRIFLNHGVQPTVDTVTGPGAFTNWDSANMVGAVVDPGDATANLFDLGEGEWVDTIADNKFGIGDATTTKTDGFIAAVNYPTGKLNHTNFVPEALLTVINPKAPLDSSNSNFIDNDNHF